MYLPIVYRCSLANSNTSILSCHGSKLVLGAKVYCNTIDLIDYVPEIGNWITLAHSNNTLDASRSVHSVSRFHQNCLRKTTFKSPSKICFLWNNASSMYFYLMSVTKCMLVLLHTNKIFRLAIIVAL